MALSSLTTLRSLLARFPDPFLLITDDGTVLRRHAGFPAEATAPMAVSHVSVLFSPNVAKSLLAAVKAAIRTDEAQRLEYVAGRDDSARWHEIRVLPLPDAQALAVLRDVTSERRNEVVLRENRAQLQLAIETANLGFFDWHVASENVYFSPRWKLQLGYADHEIQSHYSEWESRLHPDDRDATLALLQQALADPSVRYDPEFRVRHKDGTYRSIMVNATILRDESGTPVRMIGTHYDVTDQRVAERERRELEQKILAAQKTESLGILAGGIAHDFNNLLASIMGYADLALLDLPIGSAARRHIEQLLVGTRSAADLTRQMLAYSGRGRFVVAPLALSALLDEMGHFLRVSVPKGVELAHRSQPGLPTIEADASQVRQVVMNLILNAGEAIGERRGRIDATTGVERLDRDALAACALDASAGEGWYVFLEVTDTGPGMTAETLARIFDPFFTTKQTGRGLGLAAVQGIVRGHKGAIRVASELGVGTSIRVYFPASDAADAEAKARSGQARGAGKAMIIDDEEPVRNLARIMLQRLGFDVVAAADGRQGVDLFQVEAADVRFVLLDLTMPRMSGEETLRELRRVRPDVPIILTSGYAEPSVTQRVADLQWSGFLAKPYRYEDLENAVRKALA